MANAKIVVYKGEEWELPELIRQKSPVEVGTVKARIKRGWSIEDAIDKPAITGGNPLGESRGLHARSHLGIRSTFAANLFELFNKYGAAALEEAVKKQASDPETVLDFVEKYLMKLLPREANQTLDGAKQKAIITIDVRRNDPPPTIIDQPRGIIGTN